MRRRGVAAALAVAVVLLAPPVTAVPKTTCTAKTDGLPQALVQCDWDDTGSQLSVTGLAANGFASSFEAEWTSDTVRLGPNTVMSAAGSVTLAQVLAGTVDRHLLFRFKLGKLKWTPWFTAADVAQEVPNASPGGAPSAAMVAVGKLFYRVCKACPLTVGIRYGGAHSGTVAFQETLALRLA